MATFYAQPDPESYLDEHGLFTPESAQKRDYDLYWSPVEQSQYYPEQHQSCVVYPAHSGSYEQQVNYGVHQQQQYYHQSTVNYPTSPKVGQQSPVYGNGVFYPTPVQQPHYPFASSSFPSPNYSSSGSYGVSSDDDQRWSESEQEQYSSNSGSSSPTPFCDEKRPANHQYGVHWRAQEQYQYNDYADRRPSPPSSASDSSENNDYGVNSSRPESIIRDFLDVDAQAAGRGYKKTKDEYKALMQSVHAKRKKGDFRTDRKFLKLYNERAALLDMDTIDLHYLEKYLAIEVMRQRVNEIKQGLRPSTLYVCTGRGKNSKNGKATLREEIIEFAKKDGFKWEFLSLKNNGVIRIEVPFHSSR